MSTLPTGLGPGATTPQGTSYNPFLPEPYLLSVNQRTHAVVSPHLLANGWPPLHLPVSSKAVIPGVSTNAVGKNYRVLTKIGMGSFGEIYLGVDIRTDERIAIKVENRTTKYPQLMEEYQVYRAVAKGLGVPAAIWWSGYTQSKQGERGTRTITPRTTLCVSLMSSFLSLFVLPRLSFVSSPCVQRLQLQRAHHGDGVAGRQFGDAV